MTNLHNVQFVLFHAVTHLFEKENFGTHIDYQNILQAQSNTWENMSGSLLRNTVQVTEVKTVKRVLGLNKTRLLLNSLTMWYLNLD